MPQAFGRDTVPSYIESHHIPEYLHSRPALASFFFPKACDVISLSLSLSPSLSLSALCSLLFSMAKWHSNLYNVVIFILSFKISKSNHLPIVFKTAQLPNILIIDYPRHQTTTSTMPCHHCPNHYHQAVCHHCYKAMICAPLCPPHISTLSFCH